MLKFHVVHVLIVRMMFGRVNVSGSTVTQIVLLSIHMLIVEKSKVKGASLKFYPLPLSHSFQFCLSAWSQMTQFCIVTSISK